MTRKDMRRSALSEFPNWQVKQLSNCTRVPHHVLTSIKSKRRGLGKSVLESSCHTCTWHGLTDQTSWRRKTNCATLSGTTIFQSVLWAHHCGFYSHDEFDSSCSPERKYSDNCLSQTSSLRASVVPAKFHLQWSVCWCTENVWLLNPSALTSFIPLLTNKNTLGSFDYVHSQHEWLQTILSCGKHCKINADWDCFKTPVLQEILRIQNLLQVEHCAFLEAIRLFLTSCTQSTSLRDQSQNGLRHVTND